MRKKEKNEIIKWYLYCDKLLGKVSRLRTRKLFYTWNSQQVKKKKNCGGSSVEYKN